MKEPRTAYGVYVVGYFEIPERLSGSFRPKWGSIEDARQELSEQAEDITEQSSDLLIVEPFVVDARRD